MRTSTHNCVLVRVYFSTLTHTHIHTRMLQLRTRTSTHNCVIRAYSRMLQLRTRASTHNCVIRAYFFSTHYIAHHTPPDNTSKPSSPTTPRPTQRTRKWQEPTPNHSLGLTPSYPAGKLTRHIVNGRDWMSKGDRWSRRRRRRRHRKRWDLFGVGP